MSMVATQSKFAFMIARLLLYAESLGYRVTFGDAYRTHEYNDLVGGHDSSNHTRRLAIDLNLHRKVNGTWKYCRTTEEHRPLGEYWERIGGTWGGRFQDGNHYSLAWRGIR